MPPGLTFAETNAAPRLSWQRGQERKGLPFAYEQG